MMVASFQNRSDFDLGWLEPARGRGLLSGLDDRLVHELTADAHRIRYPKGAVVPIRPASATGGIVLSGGLRSYLADEEGREITFRHLGVGDIFGFLASTSSEVPIQLQALEQSEVALISRRRIEDLVRTEPAFASAVIDVASASIAEAMRAFYVRAFGTVRERVINSIIERAVMAGGLEPGQSVTGTQQELALAIGSVREVVAPVLQDLKREGVIGVRRGRVVILLPDKLVLESRGRPA